MRRYKIIQYENDEVIEQQEFTESEFLLIQSLVEDGEEYYSEEDLEQTAFNEEGEDIPIQECYAEMYSKLNKVLGITNFPNEEYDPDLGDEE